MGSMRRAFVPLRALLACWILLLAGLAGLVGPAAPVAYAEDAGEDVVETVLSVDGTPEPDEGPVSLDVTVLTTDPDTPRPAVVLAHGFGGSKDDSLETARTLARAGYAVIIYTARGFGASGGRIHLDHPEFEGADAVKIIDLAAGRDRSDQGRRRSGDRVRGRLLRRCPRADWLRDWTAGWTLLFRPSPGTG